MPLGVHVRSMTALKREMKDKGTTMAGIGRRILARLAILQVPEYPDKQNWTPQKKLTRTTAAGFCWRGSEAQDNLARVTEGKAFLLQGAIVRRACGVQCKQHSRYF